LGEFLAIVRIVLGDVVIRDGRRDQLRGHVGAVLRLHLNGTHMSPGAGWDILQWAAEDLGRRWLDIVHENFGRTKVVLDGNTENHNRLHERSKVIQLVSTLSVDIVVLFHGLQFSLFGLERLEECMTQLLFLSELVGDETYLVIFHLTCLACFRMVSRNVIPDNILFFTLVRETGILSSVLGRVVGLVPRMGNALILIILSSRRHCLCC
jgi:hypothetical protein